MAVQPLKTALTPEEAKAKRDAQLREAKAEGLAQGRKEWAGYVADAVKSGSDAVLAPMKAQHEQSIRHVRHGWFAWGLVIGGALGASLGALLANAVLGAAFDQATRVSREATLTGAIVQQTQPPARCVAGEHLPDGRVCP